MKKVTVTGQYREKKGELAPTGTAVGMGSGFSARDQKKQEPSGKLFGITEEKEVAAQDFDITIADDLQLHDDEFEAGEKIITDETEEKSAAAKGNREAPGAGHEMDIEDFEFTEGAAEVKGEDISVDDLSLELEDELATLPDTDEFKPMEDEGPVLRKEVPGTDIDELRVKGHETEDKDDTISVDLSALDYDEKKRGGAKQPLLSAQKEEEPSGGLEEDENITLDLETLDIDLVEESSAKQGIPSRKEGGPTGDLEEDEDITLDLETLDLDLAEEPTEKPVVTAGMGEATGDLEEDESITLDLDTLDLELAGEPTEEPVVTAGMGEAPGGLEEDEDITLDLDTLDLELVEDESISTGETPEIDDLGLEEKKEARKKILEELAEEEDEKITLDLDTLDLDLADEPVEEPVVTAGMGEPSGGLEEDENITLDLDTLDLDLAEDETVSTGEIPEIDDLGLEEKKEARKKILEELAEEEDEKITLDLDALDLDLVEDETVKSGEIPDSLALQDDFETISEEEDENITIDLDTLDLDLTEEVDKDGEMIDEDEKLTLDDAGITFDELTTEEMETVTDTTGEKYDEEEDIHITLDEVAPEFDINDLELETGEEPKEGGKRVSAAIPGKGPGMEVLDIEGDSTELELEFDMLEKDLTEEAGIPVKTAAAKRDGEIVAGRLDLDEAELESLDMTPFEKDLPEIDLDEFEDEEEKTGIGAGAVAAGIGIAAAGGAAVKVSDDIMDIDDREDYYREGPADKSYISVKKGTVNFSIDYTLAYSRLGAFLRLIGIFGVGLVPHFIVLLVYSVLSLILGFFNHAVIMFTRKPVEDFHAIQENTLRYFLSVYATLIGVVEEMPVFTGRDSIDYSLQFNVTYALRYSNILALLRLSGVGIILISLPHLVVLSVISAVIPFIYLIGVCSVLITGRWPYFLFDFMSRFFRAFARLMAFMTGLVDTYPPFTFS